VWVQDAGTYSLRRLGSRDGQIEVFQPFPSLARTSTSNFRLSKQRLLHGLRRRSIGRIDAKTGKITFYKTPTPNSSPRRGSMDFARPLMVRRISRQSYRHVRSGNRALPGVGPPTPWAQPYTLWLTRMAKPGLDPCSPTACAARSEVRSNDRLSPPTLHEHPKSVRGQFHNAGHFLGGQ